MWGRHNARTIRRGMAAVAQQSGITSAVQALASELVPRTPELARGMAEHLYAAIPELSAIEDDDLRDGAAR